MKRILCGIGIPKYSIYTRRYTSHHIPFFLPTTNSLLKGLFVQRTLDLFSRGFLVSSGWWCSSCLLLLLVVVVVHLSFSLSPNLYGFLKCLQFLFCWTLYYVIYRPEEEKQQKSPSTEEKNCSQSRRQSHTYSPNKHSPHVHPCNTYLFLLSFLIQMYTANFMIHIAPYQNTHKHKIGRLSVNLTSRFYIANNVVCYYWVDGQKRKL